MLGAVKRALAVAGAVTVGAMAPVAAMGDEWTEGGVQFNGAAHVEGQLSWVTANGHHSCEFAGSVQLSNSGAFPLGAADGQVSSFVPTSCATTLAPCSVTGVATSTPWATTTVGQQVDISGFSLSLTYSGSSAGCIATSASGTLTGQMTAGANAIDFTSAVFSTWPWGSAMVTGGGLQVFADDGFGSPDYGRPIELW